MGSAELNGPLWSSQPHDWATLQEPLHEPLFDAMMTATDVGPETRFLDVGCGAGCSSKLAVERGARVTGLDAAQGLIHYARGAVPDADFHTGDIENMPFADDAFDVVFAANSVQYASDLVAALRELRRVTAPGGRVVAGLFGPPDKTSYAAVFAAVKAVLPPPPPDAKPGGPFALSGPGVLEGFFEEAGLSVSGTGEVDAPFRYASIAHHWRVCRSAGPFQSMFHVVREDVLESAVQGACQPFTASDGSVEIGPNAFIYVTATV